VLASRRFCDAKVGERDRIDLVLRKLVNVALRKRVSDDCAICIDGDP